VKSKVKGVFNSVKWGKAGPFLFSGGFAFCKERGGGGGDGRILYEENWYWATSERGRKAGQRLNAMAASQKGKIRGIPICPCGTQLGGGGGGREGGPFPRKRPSTKKSKQCTITSLKRKGAIPKEGERKRPQGEAGGALKKRKFFSGPQEALHGKLKKRGGGGEEKAGKNGGKCIDSNCEWARKKGPSLN